MHGVDKNSNIPTLVDTIQDSALLFSLIFAKCTSCISAFCKPYGVTSPLWQRVQEHARESFALREVFSMQSSVRVEAVENLGEDC